MALTAGGRLRLPVEPEFEHAVLALSDPLTVDDHPITTGSMLYLGRGRRSVALHAESATRALLIGGVPFDEQLVMWWNFVARTHDEIVDARTRWDTEHTTTRELTDRFGTVPGYEGPSLPAPRLPNAPLRARPRYRHRDR